MRRTLKSITGERSRCQYCDRTLKPTTDHFEVLGHLMDVPTAEQLGELPQPKPSWPPVEEAVRRGYQKDRVFRLRHKNFLNSQQFTELAFWTGGYQGRGWSNGHGVLFCNTECATLFAVAAYRAGLRINHVGNDGG
jgi:hypothetical protein